MRAEAIKCDGRWQGVVRVFDRELKQQGERTFVLRKQWPSRGEAVSHALRVMDEQIHYMCDKLAELWSIGAVQTTIEETPLFKAVRGE